MAKLAVFGDCGNFIVILLEENLLIAFYVNGCHINLKSILASGNLEKFY